MSDEDINPTFPELEGEWVRKERLDALQAKLDKAIKVIKNTAEEIIITRDTPTNKWVKSNLQEALKELEE